MYKVGITNKVKKDESNNPLIIAPPMPSQVSLEIVIGIIPTIVHTEVITIASSRDLPASPRER
ncbi:MAG: hypothetical protein NT091_01710 [Candidatus Falkowbacteria bacterium]|nr:hypothetical protein [Candidatus Falkowbacteria bacterium]